MQCFYMAIMARNGKHLRGRLLSHLIICQDDEILWLIAKNYPVQLLFVLAGERGYYVSLKGFMLSKLLERYQVTWLARIRARSADNVTKATCATPSSPAFDARG
jgi:hypothetical protein